MTTTESGARTHGEGLIDIDGAEYYAVPDVERMAPFLMSVVSDGDRWMFVSSTGALTAGRGDATGAIFPYETDDRLHVAAGRVGPITRLRVRSGTGETVWHPFDPSCRPSGPRRLAKSVLGDAVVFEERHDDLALTFRYRWASSDRFGFVRTSTIVNDGGAPVRVELLDGVVGVMPHGLEPDLHLRLSNLANAYKRSELIDPATGLALYSLESPVSDRADPEEVLRATVVWSFGPAGREVSVSDASIAAFEADEDRTDRLVTGRPGAYLVRAGVDLDTGQASRWGIVIDGARDQIAVTELRRELDGTHIAADVEASIRAASAALLGIMAPADALQRTADPIADAHHFANVTYNVMRGGVPRDGYRIDAADFAAFVADRNRAVADRNAALLTALPGAVDRREVLERVAVADDIHLARLADEYIPLAFSRRHGDPSRPWNRFSIRVRDEHGNPVVYYEGNWRDVFQNWEALGASFPDYLPGMVGAFVNASTPDGFNPYRISRHGIDWEVPDPDDPWANIGYWGDHQLVYLLRLIDAAERHVPGSMARRLNVRAHTYADVPYRLASYEDLLVDPKATISYDDAAAARSATRVDAIGSDGRLVPGPGDDPHVVTLVEKLLVAALAKISNFVPGAGVWMNTQRPEWNDANNALVGYGASMVTLCHLREFLARVRSLAVASGHERFEVSSDVVVWLDGVREVLERCEPAPSGDADRHRRLVMDGLGRAFGRYRARVYESVLAPATELPIGSIVVLCDVVLPHLDATIRAARRPDGLFHSYNLLRWSAEGATAAVEHLPAMLEGQVAALGAGGLAPEEQADLVDALFTSALFRPDQQTFMLAPARVLPSFLDKNVIPTPDVTANPLMFELLAAGNGSIVRADAEGLYRFDADLVDEAALDRRLDELARDATWSGLVAQHRQDTLAIYEQVFGHRSRLGRSGSMYAYEGIGSVYWHMVTKLLLAVAEAAVATSADGSTPRAAQRLAAAYGRVRAGLGWNKTASDFGAIPTDPYSHTPAHAGAQQPGMTGAVKEELLVRPLELGVRIDAGELVFDTTLLRRDELLGRPSTWSYIAVGGEAAELGLDPGSLAFTLCQVPIVVRLTTGRPMVAATFDDGDVVRADGRRLGRELSAKVFARTGEVVRIEAWLPA